VTGAASLLKEDVVAEQGSDRIEGGNLEASRAAVTDEVSPQDIGIEESTGKCAAHRFWWPLYKSYLYPASATEKDRFLDLYPEIWVYEGIAWYACQP
jgi:hypothetical protein